MLYKKRCIRAPTTTIEWVWCQQTTQWCHLVQERVIHKWSVICILPTAVKLKCERYLWDYDRVVSTEIKWDWLLQSETRAILYFYNNYTCIVCVFLKHEVWPEILDHHRTVIVFLCILNFCEYVYLKLKLLTRGPMA